MNWDNCWQAFLIGLCVSSFPIQVPTLGLDSIVSPLELWSCYMRSMVKCFPFAYKKLWLWPLLEFPLFLHSHMEWLSWDELFWLALAVFKIGHRRRKKKPPVTVVQNVHQGKGWCANYCPQYICCTKCFFVFVILCTKKNAHIYAWFENNKENVRKTSKKDFVVDGTVIIFMLHSLSTH